MTVTMAQATLAIHRVNPVAKLLATLVLCFTLVLTVDWVSAAVALGLESILFFFAGLTAKVFFLRTLPVLIAAPLGALTLLLYGRPSGVHHVDFLFIHITDGSIELAAAIFLRVLAIGLPAVVIFVTVDPTDLADGLAQVLRLPARFVLGGLAGMRLVGLFLQDWKALELARRARGVADRGRVRRFVGQAFALLVLSIRRGSKLATAMEARGFGGSTRRTWARRSRLGWRDAVLLLMAAGIGAAAVTVSVLTGNWNFVVGA